MGPNDENENDTQADTELDADQSSLTEEDFAELRGIDLDVEETG